MNHGVSVSEIYRFITFSGIEISFFVKQGPLKLMYGNKWWSTKVNAKLLSDLVIFSIFSSEIPLDFLDSIWVALLKYVIYIFRVGFDKYIVNLLFL